MEWWVWVLLGLLLLLAEIITPGGFYIIFFGVGAVAVGVLAGFDLGGPLWLQVILFSVISVLALWLFREKLLRLTQGGLRQNVDSFVGETAVAAEDMAAHSIGKAEMRGASWTARNVGEKPLVRGERCTVERIEGLTIFVRAEQK